MTDPKSLLRRQLEAAGFKIFEIEEIDLKDKSPQLDASASIKEEIALEEETIAAQPGSPCGKLLTFFYTPGMDYIVAGLRDLDAGQTTPEELRELINSCADTQMPECMDTVHWDGPYVPAWIAEGADIPHPSPIKSRPGYSWHIYTIFHNPDAHQNGSKKVH